LPMLGDLGLRVAGVTVRPLCHPSLSFETCLIMRREDDSRMVNDFDRRFVRQSSRKLGSDGQMALPA